MAEIDKPYLYKDLTTLTCWAKWLLRASLAVSVISVISGIMEYRLLQAIAAGQFDSDAEMTAAARANDLRQGIIGVAYIVLLLATSVVVLVWIYGANRNAHPRRHRDALHPGLGRGLVFHSDLQSVEALSGDEGDLESERRPGQLASPAEVCTSSLVVVPLDCQLHCCQCYVPLHAEGRGAGRAH
jgi:hypothetical protein